jgi:hypothetical protein
MANKLGIAVVLGALTATAAASPQVRFGLTSGANRNTPEGVELGPMVAAGMSAGRFTAEMNYSYLSFTDPETEIHRGGVALRAGITTWGSPSYWKTLFGEVGVSKRWGQWGASESSQNEMHAGVGLQLDDKWQFGVRLGAARIDPRVGGGGCGNGVCAAASMLMPESSGLAGSIMLEWLFILDARSKNL